MSDNKIWFNINDIATYCVSNGNKVEVELSDYVAGIKIYKVPYVMQGLPYQKLCKSAMDKFRYDKESFKSFMSDKDVKYVVPVIDEFVNLNHIKKFDVLF